MSPVDVLQAIQSRPFQPFRIEVSDGAVYDVRHPELVMVGIGSVSIGVPAGQQPHPVYERVETVSLQHVAKLIPIGPPSG